MRQFNNSLLVCSATALLLAAGQAGAVTQTRTFAGGPTNYCQTALPVFDGNVRKRPLAVQNEGTSNAFVTCSFNSQYRITSVQVYFYNSGTTGTLNCTGVSGYNTGPNQFIPKSVSLTGGGPQGLLAWNAADFTGAPAEFPSGHFSISCNLLPGMGVNDSYVNFIEDVGA